MGFSLRNMLDEAMAQVNPWDHGQTASTVAAQRRPQPMPTYNAPNPLRVVSQPMQQPQLVDPTPQPVQAPPTFHLNVAPAAPAPHLYVGNTQIQADPNATTGVADTVHPGMLKSMYNSVVNPIVQTGKYAVDSGALGLSELSHNNDAINIAKQQQDDAFKQSMVPMIDRTGHMLAESNPVARGLGITPMDLQSKTIDANTQDLISKGATPEQAQNYNTAAKNKLYQDTLNNAGFTDTTSTKDMYLKALGDIGGTASLFIAPEAGAASAGAKTALIDGVEQAVTRTAAQKLASTGITAAEQGLMNGGASMATAAGNDSSISDTLKAGATGFLTAAAMTGAGAGLKAGTPKIISMAKDATDNIHPLNEVGAIALPKIITQAKDAVSQTAHDIVTGKPNRSISEAELASAAKVRDAAQGHSDAMGLTDQDMTNYYNVMKKAGGQGANDVKAVDDALAARQTYNARQEYMNSPEVKQGGYVRLPGQKTQLMATHNLSEDNLAHAHELGGIPQASVGIVDPAKHALDGYGNITLVGNEKLVDPKAPKTNTYASDVYSPRQPRAELRATGTYSDEVKALKARYGEDFPTSSVAGQGGDLVDALRNVDSPTYKQGYLKSIGVEPKAPAELVKALGNDKAQEEWFNAHHDYTKYQKYAESEAKALGAEPKIYGGTTASGTNRYLPETLDSVLKEMRKSGQRGGEDTGGIGNLRSHITPKFKSLEDIYKNKDKLTDSEKMQAVKDTLESKLFSMQDELDKHATNKSDNQFTEFDNQMTAIRDYMANGKSAEWFHEKFPNAPAHLVNKLDAFKNELQHAPTEYFESVSDRAVKLHEFEKALVPENASQKTLAILQEHGIKPVMYNPAKNVDTHGGGDLADAFAADSKNQPGLSRQEALQQLMAEDNKARGFSDSNSTDKGTILQNAAAAAKSMIKPLSESGAVGKDINNGENIFTGKKVGSDKPTGVKDAQLQQIEKARKDAVNYAADEIMQGQSGMRNVHQEIRQAGGISKSDYENIPAHLKNKNGLPMDEMAANLGFKDDGALHDAIHNQERPLTRTQARDIAEQQLESGKHPYSADYQQIKDALAARQDELSQYPNGKYRQVKVTDKPAKMSDAELASLSATPEGKIKPAGNKIVPVKAKDELRNAAAESKVIEDLNGNKGTDTAIQNYMDTTGVTLQKAVHDINRVAKEAGINTDLGKNPIEGKVLLPTVQEGDWKQATLNSRFVQSKELELGGKALDSYKALTPEDQLLLKQIETGTVNKVAADAKDPTAFKQAASDIRNYYDHRHAYDKALGIDVGYRTNYLRQLFDRVEEDKQATTGDEQLRGGGGNKNPGYTKQRTFDTLGADVGNALERDIKGSSFNHAKLAYEQGLNEAFPGKISNGEIPRSKNDGVYQQIDHPFGNDLSAPKAIAHEINSRVWHQNDSKALDVYDKLNHGFKYVKLSGGLFHAFTESGNFIGQQLASGKFFTDPAATGRMAKVFFSKDAMHNELTRMADHGVLDKAHLSGLTFTPREILADANVSALDKAKGAVHATAKYTGIQAMHDATFQREIPYAKLKIFEQKTAHLDPSKPADLVKMREQATAINNLFGGINREVQGMKPGTFKWVQRALLATDFTEGKIVTLAKALSDKSAAGNTARQAVAGKALLFGAIATAGAAAGGNYQGKTKYQIARDAAGNLIDPSFEMGGYKVGLPKTHISEVVDAIKPTSKNGKAWNASGLLSYAQNRSAALPSEAIQLLSNKNYYGQPLYGTNTKKNGGGKISTGQAASNIAQTVLPIPVGQAATTSAGKQNPAAAVANVIGFKAKPNTANDVSFQGVQTTLNDKQAEAYNNQANSTLKSMQQQLTSSDAYKNANPNDQSKMMSELKKNVDSSVQRDFASKNNIGQFAPDYTGKGTSANTKEQDILSGKINPDSYLPNSGNTDSYAVSQFKKSPKQTTQIGNDTYYKTSDGTVKHQATFDYNMGIQSAKVDFALNRFKATGNYNAWATSAQQKYDLLQQQIDHLNPDSQQADVIKLKQQQADLVDTAQKYNSYGGFDKPKSAKSQLSKLKNSYTPYSIKTASSSNNSLRSMLAAARISSPGSGRKFTAKQIVKVA